jgi:hypothetical protein
LSERVPRHSSTGPRSARVVDSADSSYSAVWCPGGSGVIRC